MDLTVRAERGPIAILTGERDSGKTSACRRLVEQARLEGLDCAGLLAPARFAGSSRVGSDVLDLRTGERRPFSYLSPDEGAPFASTPARHRVDAAVSDWAASRLDRACPCDLLIVDEIGPLELERGEGWQNALEIARRGDFGLAVLVVRSRLVPALLAAIDGCRGLDGGDPSVLTPSDLLKPFHLSRLLERAHVESATPV